MVSCHSKYIHLSKSTHRTYYITVKTLPTTTLSLGVGRVKFVLIDIYVNGDRHRDNVDTVNLPNVCVTFDSRTL